ncbi:MAG: chorismate pyruvate-lyase family protein [Bryobacteraceae bacterium]
MAQRVLLVTDGTLTDTVEALYGEPIGLRKVALGITPASGGPDPLQAPAGSPIMHRKIVLYGEETGRNYVYAESALALDRLPPAFRDGLLNTDTPIGRLWTEFRVETWKELLTAAAIPAGPISRFFPDAPGDLLTRTYRMISRDEPLMVISEYFPK